MYPQAVYQVAVGGGKGLRKGDGKGGGKTQGKGIKGWKAGRGMAGSDPVPSSVTFSTPTTFASVAARPPTPPKPVSSPPVTGRGKGGPPVFPPPSSLSKGGKGGGSGWWGGVQSDNFHLTPTPQRGILCVSPVSAREWILTMITGSAPSTGRAWHASGVMSPPNPIKPKRPSGVEVPEEQASGNPDSSMMKKLTSQP